jgi:hypothetical protein
MSMTLYASANKNNKVLVMRMVPVEGKDVTLDNVDGTKMSSYLLSIYYTSVVFVSHLHCCPYINDCVILRFFCKFSFTLRYAFTC